MKSSILLFMFLAAVVVGPVHARTWSVEKDGSGDFSVIQDAVEAAAPGDTIQIGEGRFEDFWLWTDEYSNTWDSVAIVEVDSLSIVGLGMNKTIIGPEFENEDLDHPIGIAFVGVSAGFVSGLAVENTDFGCFTSEGALWVDSCGFRNSKRAVSGYLDGGGLIQSCEFEGSMDTGIALNGPSQNVEIVGCSFVDNLAGVQCDNASQNIHVEDCTFSGGSTQLVYSGSSTGTVVDCYFSDIQNYGAAVLWYSNVTMEGNHFAHGPGVNLTVWVYATLSGSNNILEGGGLATIYLKTYPNLSFYNNQLLNAGEYTVKCADFLPPPDHIIDLAHNYWGTTDPDQISEWIFDGFDSDQVHHYVRFAPILAAPVGVDGVPPVGPTLAVYPNPFNPRTTVEFTIGADQHVSIGVYDLRGRKVVTLGDGPYSEGRHSVVWDGKSDGGRDVPAGVYLVSLRSGAEVQSKTITLVR
jgi:hypothetical protein